MSHMNLGSKPAMSGIFSKQSIRCAGAICAVFALLCGCDGPEPLSGQLSARTQETVTLAFATYQVREQERVEAAIKVFQEKNPGILVDPTFIPNEPYTQIIRTKFASGEGPDVLQLWATPESMGALGKAGYLLDLSDNPVFMKVAPSISSSCAIDDMVYMLPTNVALMGLLINTEVLSDAGVPIPTNYKEFLEACEAVKAMGVAPIAFGDKDGVESGWGCKIIYDSIASEDEVEGIVEGAVTFSGAAAFKELLTKIKELEDRGYFVQDYTSVTLDHAHEMIADAKAAFMFSAEWNFPGVLAKNNSASFALVPVPFNDSGTPKMISTIGGGVGVNADSKILDAAVMWLEFNGSQDYADTLNLDGASPIEGVTVTLSAEAQAAYVNYTDNIYPDLVGKFGFKNANELFSQSVQNYLLTDATLADICVGADRLYKSEN